MKKLIFITFITLLTSSVFASEEWFCTSQSSQMIGTTFYACGVGQGYQEKVARDESTENAISQFKAVCEISGKCRQHIFAVEPRRTSCEVGEPITDSLMYHNLRQWKCYKLVLFHMES